MNEAYDGKFITSIAKLLLSSFPATVAVVVGGGPAGCATFLALRHAHPEASILLVDDADDSVFKVDESNCIKRNCCLLFVIDWRVLAA